MPQTWNSLITILSKITRENYIMLICCPHCGNSHTYIKWGFYRRYLFNDELINIQRFRCDNDLCPCKTFSILPHALLPIIRSSLCMLMHVLTMYEQGKTIAQITRHTSSNWQRMQRWIKKAMDIRDWLNQEYDIRSSSCLSSGSSWTSFTKNFIWFFYPKKSR